MTRENDDDDVEPRVAQGVADLVEEISRKLHAGEAVGPEDCRAPDPRCEGPARRLLGALRAMAYLAPAPVPAANQPDGAAMPPDSRRHPTTPAPALLAAALLLTLSSSSGCAGGGPGTEAVPAPTQADIDAMKAKAKNGPELRKAIAAKQMELSGEEVSPDFLTQGAPKKGVARKSKSR